MIPEGVHTKTAYSRTPATNRSNRSSASRRDNVPSLVPTMDQPFSKRKEGGCLGNRQGRAGWLRDRRHRVDGRIRKMPGHDANTSVILCAAQPHNRGRTHLCAESVQSRLVPTGLTPPGRCCSNCEQAGLAPGVTRFRSNRRISARPLSDSTRVTGHYRTMTLRYTSQKDKGWSSMSGVFDRQKAIFEFRKFVS